MNDTATIRARIHDSAIRRVTRTFAATLADIFTETLQNSRRAGATRVRVAVAGPADTGPLTVTVPTTAPASPIPPSCCRSARTAGTRTWCAARTPPAWAC